MNFYIADTHFGHANIIRLDGRPFTSVGEMDEALIRLWNSRVQPDDEVYVLGDFAYKCNNRHGEYLGKLRGKLHLIVGNHDKALLNDKQAMSRFLSVDNVLTIKDGDREIFLSHYPVAEWNGYFQGVWHIFAHIHNVVERTYHVMRTCSNALNAGCMINNYMPVSFDELVKNNEAFNEFSDKYRYRLKISLRRDCEDFAARQEKLRAFLKKNGLIQIKENLYVTDKYTASAEPVIRLSDEKWFLDSAKEFVWYTGNMPYGGEEDVLESYREEGFWP